MTPEEILKNAGKEKFEVNIAGISLGVTNNKIGFSDINSDANFEELIFTGTSPVNARINSEISLPSFAMRWKKWGLAVSGKVNAKFDMIDIDPVFADRHHNVHHKSRFIIRYDDNIGLVHCICSHIPGHADQASLLFRIIGHHIRTIAAMHRDAAAPGNIADDRVSRYRITAARQLDHNSIFSLDQDAMTGFRLGGSGFQLGDQFA